MKNPTTLPETSRVVRVEDTSLPKTLRIDTTLFQHHLDDWEASDEEKAEYLNLIWSIVLQFVDLGYGIHPLQQSCGQHKQDRSACDIRASGVVDWKGQFNTKATKNAGGQRTAEREKS